ncbi:hypothetical protein [Methanolobus psychrotolerans]|nr:hypothetical protein [Methanolobus psychrotolerans]
MIREAQKKKKKRIDDYEPDTSSFSDVDIPKPTKDDVLEVMDE